MNSLDDKANNTLQHVSQIGQSQTEMDERLQDVHVGVQASNQVGSCAFNLAAAPQLLNCPVLRILLIVAWFSSD